MVGAEGTKILILTTLDYWKRHFREKNYIENYFHLLKSTKSTKTTSQNSWRNIWADFFGCPHCTNGIKTCLGSLLYIWSMLQVYLKYTLNILWKYTSSISEVYFIVCKEVQAPLLFKAPTPWPSLPPFLKPLFPLLSFLFHPLLRHFTHFPHPQATSSCPNPTNQPYLV